MRTSGWSRGFSFARFSLATCSLYLLGCGGERKLWSVPAADPATRRSLSNGEVVGGLGRYESHAWLGIPFAAPPIGELRWRSPRPPQSWTSPKETLKYPARCPQFGSALEGTKPDEVTGNEDCLYLNVWAPRFASDAVPKGKERLPVMFWIHGGGNSLGSSNFYDGGHLAASQRTIVVVTQYRLGPFGWMSHPALRADAADDAERSGNFGVLDLERGLEWVRDNIAAFGGDPNNVTVFGESAGAADTFALLLSPKAKGLFHRAIAESGGLRNATVEEAENFVDASPPGNKSSSNEALSRMLIKDGLAADHAAAKARITGMSLAEVAKYLRAKSVVDVMGAYSEGRIAGMIRMPLLFRDGAVLPKGDWLERLSQPGGWNRVPVILGTNRDEMRLFLFMDPARVTRLFGLFPRFVDEPSYLTASDYLSRAWKAVGADEPAIAMRRSGADSVYVYRFDWDDEPVAFGADLSKMLGASHGAEVPFVFGHFDLGPLTKYLFPLEGAPDRNKLSDAMMSYWAELAWAGAPGHGRTGDLPEWRPWDDTSPEAPRFMVLRTLKQGGARMSADFVTRPRVIEDLVQDPRLPSSVDKCRILHDLVEWNGAMTKEEYARQSVCADLAFAGYPWSGKEKR